MLMDNLYYQPKDLYDLSEQLFKVGDYEGSDFIAAEIKGWEDDFDSLERTAKYYERKEDELSVGMRHQYNLVENLIDYINQSPRINRKELLARLTEIKQDFGEYI